MKEMTVTKEILKSSNPKNPNTDNMKNGWEIKKLGEVVDIINGRNQSQVISENGEYPIFGSAGNLMGYATDYLCEKGTTIIGRKGNISNPIFIEERFWNVDTAFGLFPKNGYDPKFINYLCQTIDFKSRNRGTTIPSLVKSDLLTIDVPFISPLHEQKRIVSILDECFSAIEKAKANAEQNLKNAKELFESYLQGVFEKKSSELGLGGLKDDKIIKNDTKEILQSSHLKNHNSDNGEGWEEKKLVEVFEIKPPKKEAREKLSDNDLVSFLPMEDLGVCENEINPAKEKPLKDVVGSYTYFAENDVLLAKITPCFENGKLGVAKNLTNGIGFGSSEYIVFRCPDFIVPEFLFYFLSRASLREEGKKYMSGAVGHKRVSKDWIENYSFFFPKSKSDQQTIVRQLDALRAETQKLETVYQKKIADLEELKKSILQKAFAGELMSELGFDGLKDD